MSETDHALGASQERRRILAVILDERTIWELSGEARIAGVLDALALKVAHDHNEDNEQ